MALANDRLISFSPKLKCSLLTFGEDWLRLLSTNHAGPGKPASPHMSGIYPKPGLTSLIRVLATFHSLMLDADNGLQFCLA